MMSTRFNQQVDILKESNIVPIFYYVRTPLKQEEGVTICLLYDQNNKEVLARGISICSTKDQFVKRIGRIKAQGRAMQALFKRESSGEVFLPCILSSSEAEFRSVYKPELFPMEKELLERRTKGDISVSS